jgi:hypothetical protein
MFYLNKDVLPEQKQQQQKRLEGMGEHLQIPEGISHGCDLAAFCSSNILDKVRTLEMEIGYCSPNRSHLLMAITTHQRRDNEDFTAILTLLTHLFIF